MQLVFNRVCTCSTQRSVRDYAPPNQEIPELVLLCIFPCTKINGIIVVSDEQLN